VVSNFHINKKLVAPISYLRPLPLGAGSPQFGAQRGAYDVTSVSGLVSLENNPN